LINNPEIINLPKIGELDQGYISLIQVNDLLPFNPKRIYWIYDVSKETVRGGHYHHKLEQVIICISGQLNISLESINGFKKTYILNEPNKALYVPPGYWRDIIFHENAVLLCIASENYDENDYVRSYKEFKNIS
jgi:dTDP-4-dehydrorhamnose 3,5-epimerase-like enzyme